MNYSYIALVDNNNQRNRNAAYASTETVLYEMGLQNCFSLDPVKIFIPKQTPTLLIPGYGVIIGHLFSRDGQPVVDGCAFAQFTNYSALEKNLLDNYWGEYLLFYMNLSEKGKELKILRDPSGGVPCFYSLQAGIGFVTSNISMATHLNLYNKKIDWDYIAHTLVFDMMRTFRTGLSDVNELLPGCSLNLHGTHVTTQVAWTPWDFVAAGNRYRDPDEAAAKIRKAVSMVVKSMAEKDGVILLKLSGGLDSSIVAACLREIQAHVICCTNVIPGFATDEQQYARQMTDYLGLELHVEHSIPEDGFYFPTSPDAVIPWFIGAETTTNVENTHNVTSVFSGHGGDSIFGYLSNTAPAVDALKECGLVASFVAIQNLSVLWQCTLWEAGRLTFRRLRRGWTPPWEAAHLYLSSSKVRPIMLSHPWLDAPVNALPGDWEKIWGLVAMQSSKIVPAWENGRLERAPLLAQPVMEACLKVPSWMSILGGRNRSVARAAFADCLPKDILNRRGKGNYTNYRKAACKRNKVQIHELLLEGHLRSQAFLDVKALEQLFKKEAFFSDDVSLVRVFNLCKIENWIRHQI